jgi:poly-beta-hydroxybutyrate-responsive repressor
MRGKLDSRADQDDLRFAPRNFIRASVLLLLKEQPDHGYGLIDRLGAMGIAEGNPGAVYRTLRALELAGLVDSTWAASAGGRSKRVYVVTPSGESVLAAWTRALHESSEALNAYLGRYARHVRANAG